MRDLCCLRLIGSLFTRRFPVVVLEHDDELSPSSSDDDMEESSSGIPFLPSDYLNHTILLQEFDRGQCLGGNEIS